MKKFTTAFIIFSALYFTFNGCIPREREKENSEIELLMTEREGNFPHPDITHGDLILFYQNEGYTLEAATHLSDVEMGLTEMDEYYIAIIED